VKRFAPPLAVALALLAAAPAVALPSAGGDVRWARRYDGPITGDDYVHSAVVSPDGSTIFVTGDSQGMDTGRDYATTAYVAATGAVRWVGRYDGPDNGLDLANAVATSPDGSWVFVTGQSPGVDTGDDYATIAYDAATGENLWTARYDGPGNDDDDAQSLAVSPDGSTVFVTGSSAGPDIGSDYATIAYHADTGAVRWIRRYSGPADGGDDAATSLAASPDGSTVFVTGTSRAVDTGDDYATIAYDAATGEVRWMRRYSGPGDFFHGDIAYAVATSPDGSTLFVTGSSEGAGTGTDYATIAYDAATGEVRWIRRFSGPEHFNDYPGALAASPDGSTVFVTGVVQVTPNGSDVATIAYDAATGAVRWFGLSHGPAKGFDGGDSIAVNADASRVFVTGSSQRGSRADFATIAYDAATGDIMWTRRYSGPHPGSSSSPTAVVAGPDGSTVFVAGYSNGVGTGYDYATIAYDAGP
jgi:WD40 repeat protein